MLGLPENTQNKSSVRRVARSHKTYSPHCVRFARIQKTCSLVRLLRRCARVFGRRCAAIDHTRNANSTCRATWARAPNGMTTPTRIAASSIVQQKHADHRENGCRKPCSFRKANLSTKGIYQCGQKMFSSTFRHHMQQLGKSRSSKGLNITTPSSRGDGVNIDTCSSENAKSHKDTCENNCTAQKVCQAIAARADSGSEVIQSRAVSLRCCFVERM